MAVPLRVVDAFTDRAFTGNPAAVCVIESSHEAGWMQRVAAEMNLSETVFVSPGKPGVWAIRWFTPACEVELCGHATLAAAHALWEDGRSAPGAPLRFDSASGELRAARDDAGWITLDFPARPPGRTEIPPALAPSLRGTEWFGYDGNKMLAVFPRERDVAAFVPDLRAVAGFEGDGLIVSAPGETCDFVSRFFAPRVGIDEDPVCGSAHCALGPFWAERLGKTTLEARQLSSRGGVLRVSVSGDRVGISGRAVTVVRGELTAAADPEWS